MPHQAPRTSIAERFGASHPGEERFRLSLTCPSFKGKGHLKSGHSDGSWRTGFPFREGTSYVKDQWKQFCRSQRRNKDLRQS